MTSYAPEPVLDPNRPFMLTQDGVVFFDLPGTSYLSSDDIARSLSNLCRFGGHTPKFYTVAEHSVYVSCLLLGHGPLFALAGLVHDGTEAIVQDMVKPLKDLFPDYKAFEDRVAPLVLSTLAPNVPLGEFTNLNLISAVKKADLDLLGWELSSFFGERGFDVAYNGDTSRREISKVSKELGIHEPSCLPPDLAKALFTSTLTRLLSELEC